MKPINMKTWEVQALLAGRKSTARRIVKPQPQMLYYDGRIHEDDEGAFVVAENQNGAIEQIVSPYRPGNILYVRETWTSLVGSYLYKADQKPNMTNPGKWQPSTHMPKEAARLFLRVTDVRVERLQEIGYDACLREGITAEEIDEYNAFRPVTSAKILYKRLWDTTLKPKDRPLYGWDANPQVWVIEFERVSREEALS